MATDAPWRTARHPYESVPLIVISGVGRSGTTALRESLGLHPDVHSTGRENNIIYDVADTAFRNCTAYSRRFAMLVSDAEYDAAFRTLLLSLLWPAPRAALPARLLAFTDLTPERAGYLARVFPGARIIYVVRNGIEVVASRMRYEGFRRDPFEFHAAVWAAAADFARWGAGRTDFLLVRHEMFLAPGGPGREIARMCAFLGVPYAEACTANLAGTRYHPTRDSDGAPASAAMNTRAERWRTWTGEQIELFDDLCAGAMDYFGYERPWASEEARRRAG